MSLTSRRNFMRTAAVAGGASLTFPTLVSGNPAQAAANQAGIKPGDLPDLTITEIKVYVTDLGDYRSLNQERGQIVSITTASGHEALYPLGNRNATPNWHQWANGALVGKSVLEVLPSLTSTTGLKGPYGFNGDFSGARGGQPRYRGGNTFNPTPPFGEGTAFESDALLGSGLVPRGGGNWPNWYKAAADVCLWDLLGQAMGVPIYKILPGGVGDAKDRLIAYASSLHLEAVEDYAPEALRAKQQGYLAYKIHPGAGARRRGAAIPAYLGHIEEIKQVREAVGPDFVLSHDPVQMYNRYEALMVGRVLDEQGYAWYEDPIRSGDMDGLIELCRELTLPIHVGEFVYSIADFAEYISKGALDVVRLILDDTGGISGSMRLGLLADAFGLECTPHNWGNPVDIMAHCHLELALPNASWFEVPYPHERAEHPLMDIQIRPDATGFIMAPTAPGMGVPWRRDELDRRTTQVLR